MPSRRDASSQDEPKRAHSTPSDDARDPRDAQEAPWGEALAQALALTDAQIVCALSPDGAPQDVPEEWLAYTGQSREQAAGRGALAAVHPDDRAATLATIQQALAARRTFQAVCRIRRHDGAYQSFLLRGAPLWTADGQLRQWVGVLMNLSAYDDTQRDRADGRQPEAARGQAMERAASPAQMTEDRFRRLLESKFIGILVGDRERVIEANDAFLDLIGYTRDDLEAGGIRWDAITPPEYAPRDNQAMAELLERGECAPFEKEYVRKDGRRILVLVGHTLWEREPLQWVSFVVDQTERQRLERELAARSRLLEGVFEAMTDGVTVYGPGGDIRMMNTACRQMLGYDDPQVVRSMEERARVLQPRHPLTRELLPADEWPGVRVLRGETLTGARSVDVLLLRAYGGREALINYAGAPIRDEQGRIVGAVVVLRDVTERRRLERELAERATEMEVANQRLDDFLHMVAHELRTPLTSLKVNLQLAARRLQRAQLDALPEPGEPASAHGVSTVGEETGAPAPVAPLPAASLASLASAREVLQRADQQVEHLNRLLNDLADASRVRTGKLELHPAPCDLAALARRCVEEQRRVTKRALRLSAPAGVAPVLADASRVEQVLTNYLTNAAKYSPPEEPIEVSLTLVDGRARVAVCDHGQGLTPEEQRDIWERLYQVDRIQAEGGPAGGGAGLGLGLYISRSIIEGHGGAVGVESAVGQGSTFWFTLPLVTPSVIAPQDT